MGREGGIGNAVVLMRVHTHTLSDCLIWPTLPACTHPHTLRMSSLADKLAQSERGEEEAASAPEIFVLDPVHSRADTSRQALAGIPSAILSTGVGGPLESLDIIDAKELAIITTASLAEAEASAQGRVLVDAEVELESDLPLASFEEVMEAAADVSMLDGIDIAGK